MSRERGYQADVNHIKRREILRGEKNKKDLMKEKLKKKKDKQDEDGKREMLKGI